MKSYFRLLWISAFAILNGCTGSGNGHAIKVLIDSRSTDYEKIAALIHDDPSAKTPDGQSCLYYAVKMERFDIAEVLAVNGARMTSGEAHILFDVETKKTFSKRYKFLEPMFPSVMGRYSDGIPVEEQKHYVCRSGDYPERIAKRLRCTVEALRTANPDVDFDLLREGQKLLIPPRGK